MIHSRCGKRSPEGYAQAFSKRLLHLCPVGIIYKTLGATHKQHHFLTLPHFFAHILSIINTAPKNLYLRPLHLCPVGIIQTMIGSGTLETVQESLDRHALHAENPCGFGYFTGFPLSRLCKNPSLGMPCGKPNPLNPPCQGDLSLNSPLIRGARGVRNDKYWFFAQSLWSRHL